MSYQYNARLSGMSDEENDFATLLEDSSKDELQELMNNEDKINEIVTDQDKIKKIKLDKELLQAANRSIADHTISKEPVLNELRETLSQRYEKLKDLYETFQTNQVKLESLREDVNLETMLAVLQTTCADTEEKSEQLAEKLFSGELPVNDFLTEFKLQRTQAHMRHIKMEKMRELILEVQRNPPISSATPAPKIPPRVPSKPSLAYPSSAANQSVPGAYSAQYTSPHPQYPSNAFSQPTAQQYPSYNWR